jgi:hypothetical protein
MVEFTPIECNYPLSMTQVRVQQNVGSQRLLIAYVRKYSSYLKKIFFNCSVNNVPYHCLYGHFTIRLVPAADTEILSHGPAADVHNSRATFQLQFNRPYFTDESRSDNPPLLRTPHIVKIYFQTCVDTVVRK